MSKTRSAADIRKLFELGQVHFGENYLQEALDKQAQLEDLNIEWHFIGPIQSNKTRSIAEHFSWVHSVDRMKIARRLNEQRPLELPPLNICIQVNIDEEPSKSGISPSELKGFLEETLSLPNIQLRGLMSIPSPEDAASGEAHKKLKELFEDCRSHYPNLAHWDTLSMGMSADLEPAIANGASLVRVGTDLFGARPKAN